jgi:RNase adapter protein RapZ
MATSITSFGFRYGQPVPINGSVGLVADVRNEFRNPHHDPKLRKLTGLDLLVRADVERSIGFTEKYLSLKRRVEQAHGPVWIGCMGGRHRSVYLADRIGRELGIPVTHRDLDKR